MNDDIDSLLKLICKKIFFTIKSEISELKLILLKLV